jgi:Transposase DDE domain
MTSIPQVSTAIKTVLVERASALERPTGFVERSTAELNGPIFAQTLVFGLLDNPQASYTQLRHVAATLGAEVSRQAVQQRFGPASVTLMRQLLEEAVGQVMISSGEVPELLSRFTGVYLQDGTRIGLPASMAEQWPSIKGQVSGMHVQACIDYGSGQWRGLWIDPGRQSESSSPAIETPLPKGSLHLLDSGYLNLPRMRQWDQDGRFWIMPPRSNLICFDERGVRCSLLELLSRQSGNLVDLTIRVGGTEQLPVRLVARRLPKEQADRARERAQHDISTPPKGAQRPNKKKRATRSKTGKRNHHGKQHRRRTYLTKRARQLLDWRIVLTNVPRDLLDAQEVLVLARCRWQIELIWKWGKQIVKVDTWRSEQPERILTEIFAKWLGMLISHWLMLLDCWQDPRHSRMKAHQAVQWMAPVLALSLTGAISVESAVGYSAQVLRRGWT